MAQFELWTWFRKIWRLDSWIKNILLSNARWQNGFAPPCDVFHTFCTRGKSEIKIPSPGNVSLNSGFNFQLISMLPFISGKSLGSFLLNFFKQEVICHFENARAFQIRFGFQGIYQPKTNIRLRFFSIFLHFGFLYVITDFSRKIGASQ